MVWLDFEATGPMNNPNTVPLEGAAIITDGNLNELAVLKGIVIHATEDELSHMGAFVLKMHTDKVRDSSVTLDEFDTALREFAAPYFPAKGKPLADGTNYRGIAIGGNSVKFDFDVIEKFFPQTRATTDYRVIDISSTGELVLRWSPKAWAEMPPKASDHTALTDIREGTALLPPGPGRMAWL